MKQLCSLLTAADPRLAAAAASAVSVFYGPEQGFMDEDALLFDHIADIGTLLSNPAATGLMDATGPPLAVGRLTVAAASSSRNVGCNAKSLEATAAALLPGLDQAISLAGSAGLQE